MVNHPYIFDEFFASGKEESISPFLTPDSRAWGKNLPLKSALSAAFFWIIAFAFSFFQPTLSLLFLIPVYVFAGTPALIDSLRDMRNWEINIDVLMTLAAFLSVLIGSEMEGALLLVLFELSGAMENSVTQKTKTTLSSLYNLSPKIAYVWGEDGAILQKAVKDIALGTRLLIRAGEIVPLDGVVVEGSSFVNLVHLTGESQPIAKKPSDSLPAGARNLEGTLTIEVTRTTADSTLSRIISLITEAQEAKPKLEQLLDRFGKRYATTIILLFFFFAATLPLFFSIPYLGMEGAIYRALSFLIAASPCALIIATPTAYLSAISSCAKKGILLKGGIIFDALDTCKSIAFDKTGTLTTGKLACTQMEPLENDAGYSLDTLLSIAASLERHAVHPIAEAICAYATREKVSYYPIKEFKVVAGFGVEAKVTIHSQELPVLIGNADYISTQYKRAPLQKGTFLLVGNTLCAFHFTDELRPKMQQTLQQLKLKDKKRLIMLTGDHLDNAQKTAGFLGLDEIHADMRPQDKLDKVAQLSQEGGLIMVGDGINDAPALARATVGISLGKIGSATAVDASDVVLLQDDLSLISYLIGKSDKTMTIIKQNLLAALAVILLATTPALLGFIPLWLAVLLHEGGTILVGLNSLRLLRT